MKEKTLKEKTFSGLSWSVFDKLFQQIFVLFCSIAFARMIEKESFGLLGILAIFTGICNILQESGFSAALIRKKNVSQSEYITVFYTNIVIGIVLYILLFFTAPFISSYYNQPIITPLSRVLFLSFLFNSFAVVQNARLIKDINYRFITKNNIIATIASYSIALILAYFGFEFWALVAQIVLISLIKTCNFWIFSKWRPSGSFSFKVLKEFFSFSSKLMISSLLGTSMANIPQNIIGKNYSMGITGLYNYANRMINTVSDFLAGTIQSIPFPILSTIEDLERWKRIYRKFVRIKAFIVFPLFIGMILLSKPFVISVLGEVWIDSYPILQLLCIGGIFSALDTSNGDILRIKGKSGIILSFVIFQAILMICLIAVILFLKLNYLYLIAGIICSILIKLIVTTIYSNRLIQYTLIELFKDLLPYLTISLFSASLSYLLNYIIFNQLLLLFCQGILFFSVYIGLLHILGSTIVKETFNIIKNGKNSIA